MRTRRALMVLVMLAMCGRLAAAQDSALVPGALVRVTTADNARHVGRILSVDDTLLVIDPADILRPRERFDRRHLTRIEVKLPADRRESATVLGALVGAGIGGVIGASTVHNDCSESGGGFGPCIGRGQATVTGVLAGAVVGGLIGRLAAGRDRWRVVTEATR